MTLTDDVITDHCDHRIYLALTNVMITLTIITATGDCAALTTNDAIIKSLHWPSSHFFTIRIDHHSVIITWTIITVTNHRIDHRLTDHCHTDDQ